MTSLADRVRQVLGDKYPGRGGESRWATDAGLTRQHVSTFLARARKGEKATLSLPTIAALAKAAGCREAWLATGDGDPYATPRSVERTREEPATKSEIERRTPLDYSGRRSTVVVNGARERAREDPMSNPTATEGCSYPNDDGSFAFCPRPAAGQKDGHPACAEQAEPCAEHECDRPADGSNRLGLCASCLAAVQAHSAYEDVRNAGVFS